MTMTYQIQIHLQYTKIHKRLKYDTHTNENTKVKYKSRKAGFPYLVTEEVEVVACTYLTIQWTPVPAFPGYQLFARK